MGRQSVLPVTEENENGLQASYHCKLWETAKMEYSNCRQRCRVKGTLTHHQRRDGVQLGRNAYSVRHLHLCEKAPDMNSLRGKGSCGSQFQRLNHGQGLCCPYTCSEVRHHGRWPGGGNLLTSWQPGNRDREEGARDDIHPSKSYSPVTRSLQPYSTF